MSLILLTYHLSCTVISLATPWKQNIYISLATPWKHNVTITLATSRKHDVNIRDPGNVIDTNVSITPEVKIHVPAKAIFVTKQEDLNYMHIEISYESAVFRELYNVYHSESIIHYNKVLHVLSIS